MGFGVEAYKDQKYDKIKKELLKTKTLFTDPEFPPTQKTLFYSSTDDEIKWQRPTELCKVPKLVIDGVSCDDLIEGELGNRWFITACSSLANHKQLFSKVVPDASSQEYNMETYTGIFKFQFWLYGKWTEVVVDDYLPTKHGKLVFCHSKSKNEFWSALLEKAYAKLFGDYESLTTGLAVDALVDMTGGVAERFDIASEDCLNKSVCMSMSKQLQDALENNALVVAEIREPESSTPVEEVQPGGLDLPDGTDMLVIEQNDSPPNTNGSGGSSTRPLKTGYFRSNSIVRDGYMLDSGLLKCHGYNVREIASISLTKGEHIMLVRLQSPWQTGEWMGRWSNVSAEMKNLSVQEKTKLGLKFESESEFWMLISDFLESFTHIDVCHFINTSAFSLKKTWTESQIVDNWQIAGTPSADRAGGNFQHKTFLQNPQYIFDVTDTMDGLVMVSLEQNDRTLARRGERGNSHNLEIGFTIMKVEENRKYRLHRPGDIIASSDFNKSRSVFYKTPLYKGRYVIVPCTGAPKQNGEFLLRIYNSTKNEARPLVKDEPTKPSLICVSSPCIVVQLTVVKAEGLVSDKPGPLNPFCTVKCEGDSIKTHVVKDSDSPNWNTKFIFFKKSTDEKSCITIQVYSSQTITNTSLGEATVRDIGDPGGKPLELSLFQKSKKKDQPDIELAGKLHVHVFSSENLSEF